MLADGTGQPAPRFRAKTTTGDQFNNASVKGKVVLFEFWTTWCKYCEAEASPPRQQWRNGWVDHPMC
jgi:peroxiredoxin